MHHVVMRPEREAPDHRAIARVGHGAGIGELQAQGAMMRGQAMPGQSRLVVMGGVQIIVEIQQGEQPAALDRGRASAGGKARPMFGEGPQHGERGSRIDENEQVAPDADADMIEPLQDQGDP